MMNSDPFAALPATRRDIACAATAAVLGSTDIVKVRPVTGGVSGAVVLLIESSGRRFVLRIEGTPSPLRNPHQYVSMRIAAEAGIAPRIHYLNADDRVVMMDFIEDRPSKAIQAARKSWRRRLGRC
jgi:hypothetical protein